MRIIFEDKRLGKQAFVRTPEKRELIMTITNV